MIFIKLNQKVTIERQGQYGWEQDAVYEPVFVAAEHIVSMYFAGLTTLKMTTGERIEVRETPEEIMTLINGSNHDEAMAVWAELGDKA
ncbi:hypothetical protein HMPREF9693_05446 [Klebsiella oxytoca 10-5249]|uniref:hypothetical protein n=1 Tax=Klebsiella oxytoca TaxID=571 RepID=UPI00066C755B|nr:hypothetical protein [Klebsiella oxytoca]KMV90414.1 hypothetical protein HMPREF9693_05446 [Klebsiella oxytoca 10-5249]